MDSEEIIYTVFYVFFAFIYVAPPAEIVSSGVTLENLFSFYLGQESRNLVMYHIRRTTLLRFLHTLVLPGYFIAMHCLSPMWNLLYVASYSVLFKAAFTTSIALPVCIGIQCLFWVGSGWDLHPIVVNMKRWNSGGSWTEMVNTVNMEFRAFDKFVRRIGNDLIVATENWVVKFNRYSGWVVHQSDVRLEVLETDQHDFTVTAESDISVTQYLRLMVFSESRRKPVFGLRIVSGDFEELKLKVHHPIHIGSNVVFVQSVEERFLSELRRVVDRNPKYTLPQDMETDNCIGCLQQPSDVKLVKTCTAADCHSCFCRPMWCFDCVARWFASQQRQRGSEVTTWMGQQSTCPTCRSVFCVLDICQIERQ